jgi:predicted acyl esterase
MTGFTMAPFREQNLPYIYNQEATRDGKAKWWTDHLDDYDTYMQAGSAGELGRRHGLEQVGFWRKVLAHPSYDSFWSDQAMDKILAAQPLKVPVMLVDSLWDQEDIYGAMAVYKAIKPKDTDNDKVFLVIGPWHHGQEIEDASTLGVLNFGSDTGLYFRQQILRPFLDRYLKDETPKEEIAPVTAFDTGTNVWRSLPSWPAGCTSGCSIQPRRSISRRSETELHRAQAR